jgi:4-hydroxy-tetrahydrodipicolinate synthase
LALRSARPSIDFERFSELAQYLVESRSDGRVVARTLGANLMLGDDESHEPFRVAVDTRNGRGTVVLGTGTLVVIPCIESATISLAGIPTFRAVEQANDDALQARRVLGVAELDLDAGKDNLSYRCPGGIGGACVPARVAGPRGKTVIRAVREGVAETARRIDKELQPVYELLKVQTNSIEIEAALNLLGHDVGGLRLPLVQASDGEVARVRDCLGRLGFLGAAAV